MRQFTPISGMDVDRCGCLNPGRIPLFLIHLRFLIQNGTVIAFRNGMNSEMNPQEMGNLGAMANLGAVNLERANLDPSSLDRANLDGEGVLSMRRRLHELANVFTGVMIAGDLLSLRLARGPLEHYAAEICVGSERGCALVREIRSQLLAACGEIEISPHGRGAPSSQKSKVVEP